MKQAFIAFLALFVLTSCQVDPPSTELPFTTHPSVLRGGWSGMLSGSLDDEAGEIQLRNLSAECFRSFDDEGQEECYNYTFEGDISILGGELVPISGEGWAGVGQVYVLRTPLGPPSISASFEFEGTTWRLEADYRPYNPKPTDESPFFEGRIENENGVYDFTLEPTP